MRALIFAAITAALSTAPGVAQKSQRTLASPPPSGPSGTSILYRMLTVTYPAIGQGKMTLSTPAGSFTCTPPGAVVAGLPSFTCKAKVKRGPLALDARWLVQDGPNAQTGNGKPIFGKQWGGDCTGTTGESCILDMSTDHSVAINQSLKDAAQ